MRAIRILLVAVLAIGAAVLVVRSAAVNAWVQKAPDLAARFWPGHPRVIIRSGLEAIGRDAVARRPANPVTVAAIIGSFGNSPLEPDPFVVRGIDAQLRGDEKQSLGAFRAAIARDPRSLAGRYFLADHYVATGNIDAGLDQVSVLSRLVPKTIPTLVPALAKFAQMPGGGVKVKAMLRDNRRIEPYLLDGLAGDAANAGLVMNLWSGGPIDPELPQWQSKMVRTLVEAGNVERAYAVWSRFDGAPTSRPTLVFNPGFDPSEKAPPPFNWTVVSNKAGVAEPSGNAGLRILYYGREDVVLASQTLRLAPGAYRLQMTLVGGAERASVLGWTIDCLASKVRLGRLELTGREGATQERSLDFTVPASCASQHLELRGTAPEFPDTVNAEIGMLKLSRVGSQ